MRKISKLRLVQNQSKNVKYNLISIHSTLLLLCMYIFYELLIFKDAFIIIYYFYILFLFRFPSQVLRYRLESDHSSIFLLDEDTGALRLRAPLDFESRRAYNISVRATDDGNPPLSSVTHLIILVSGDGDLIF